MPKFVYERLVAMVKMKFNELIIMVFASLFSSSQGNNVKDDVATRRAQITQKIHQTHQGMFRPMKPMQLTEHPNAR